jgi:hypothetical protein
VTEVVGAALDLAVSKSQTDRQLVKTGSRASREQSSKGPFEPDGMPFPSLIRSI